MTHPSLLADAIRHSRELLLRYATGFDDSNYVRQAPSLPNHFAWTLGHLSLTLHRIAEKIDAAPLPASDFATGDTRRDPRQFDTESVCFGSTPAADASKYPTCDRCLEIFNRAVDRCAAAFESAGEAQLLATVPWGSAQVPVWLMAIRMVFHNGTHCGQLADLRRALGLGSIFA